MTDIKNKLLKFKHKIGLIVRWLFATPKTLRQITPQYYLSVVCIMKNEGRYLREWLEYHLWAGVEHFYIYDNGSTDKTKEILFPYIQNGTVSYHYIEGRRLQARVYNDAIARYRHCTRWLAIIDADEFIALGEQGKKKFCGRGGVMKYFKAHEQYPAVALNWCCFDGGGNETMPEHGYVIENYRRVHKNPDTPINLHVKSVVQPTMVKFCPSYHFCFYKEFRLAVDENLHHVHGAFTKHNSVQIIRINHYWSKSKEEFLEKINVRGYADNTKRVLNKSDWDYDEWKIDNNMDDAVEFLRSHGVQETYGRR